MSLVAIPNITALRQQDPSINNSIFVMGANTINDGGAGMYIFVPSSGAVDNGTTIIRSLSAQGCWFLNLANNPSGSQPTDGTFVLVSPDSSLPNSRTIVAGSGITIVDGGAGGSLTISSSGGISTATLPLIITASNIALGTAVGPTTPDATSSVTWSPSGAASAGLVLQAKPSQSVPMMEIQTSTGVVCFSLPVPITTLTGSDNNLIGIGAGSILSSGNSNNIIGTAAGGGIQTGISNTIIGNNAGSSGSAGSMSSTTMIGSNAGLANTANQNSFFGAQCGISNTSGTGQAFFGYAAGASVTGSDNSIFGADAGDSFTTGARNCLFGKDAGGAAGATSMSDTVMVGYRAGLLNTGNENIFIGSAAGDANTSGLRQTFVGYNAGGAATGSSNSLFGYGAGANFTTGAQNCIFGWNAGSAAAGGAMTDCCFFGRQSGIANTASENSFFGAGSGVANTSGTGQAFFGYQTGAFVTGNNNTLIGHAAGGTTLATGVSNILLGKSTDTTLSNSSNNFVAGSSACQILDVYFGEGMNDSSAVAYTINGTGGSGSNNAGANLQLAGGKGTGTAEPGLVIIKYPLKTTTGTTLQSLSTQSYPVCSTLYTGNISNVTVDAGSGTGITTLVGTIVGSKSLEGGMLRAGRVLNVKASGIFTTTGSPPTYIISIRIGSTVVYAANLQIAASLTGFSWEFDIDVLCRTVGASGTTAASGMVKNNISTIAVHGAGGINTATVDTTAAGDVDVSITFGTATAGNTITCSNVSVKVLN